MRSRRLTNVQFSGAFFIALIYKSRGVALNTVRKLHNACLDMLFANVVWLMSMAVGASVLVVLPQVTTLAVVFAFLAMVEGEGMNCKSGR